MSLPRVLIVGHGYLGASLAEDLSGKGAEVTAVNREGQSLLPYRVLAGDVSSERSLAALAEEIAPAPPEVIVHCASSSRGGEHAYRAVFVDGMNHLTTLFPGVPIVFTSSTSVYGQTDGSLVDERSVTSPDRETSRLLLVAEDLARDSGGIALRLAGIYGPGRSVYLQKILDGSAAIETGSASRYLNQIHRDDAVAAIAHFLATEMGAHHGGIFNVVDDTPLTQRQCYESLAEFFQVPIPPESPPATDRKRAWTNKTVSNAALRATGWRPRYPSFLDAVREDPRLVPSIRELLDTSP